MKFQKYMHLERFGNDEVQGIELGDCFVFPKLDGTNASVWFDGEVKAGSRNRELSIGADNAGFLAWVQDDIELNELVAAYPQLTFYGEWLVPHSLKTYREDAWRKFYIVDVYDWDKEVYLPFNEYSAILHVYNVDYLSPLCIIKNATYDNLLVELENNTYLIQDGKGSGEGIVIKNYAFKNRYGNTVWAKMVTNTFKEKHTKELGANYKDFKEMIEQEICDQFVDKHLVDKAYSKIVIEMDGWSSKYIPRLLQTVYYDLVNEEIWNIVKKKKNPTINFKTLNTICILTVKSLKSELF